MKLKLNMSIKILAAVKKCLTWVIIQLNQNIMIILTDNWLVKWKVKAGVAIEELAGLKPKMYSYLVDSNIEHQKAKWVNKNVVATISHNEYKLVLWNKRGLRHFDEWDSK